MNQSQLIKERYADIICKTQNKIPTNYEVIRFDLFIERKFPNLNAFIPSDTISKIRTALVKKYGNYNNCINEQGILKLVRPDELKYYQIEVGISGSKHTPIEEPVHVIQSNGSSILLNGYHRMLFRLVEEQMEVRAYVLEMNF